MYLLTPPSSTDCERIFSQAGLLLANNRRGRLGPDKIEKTMLIKSYMREREVSDEKKVSDEETEYDIEDDYFEKIYE